MRLFVEPKDVFGFSKTAASPTISMPENVERWPMVVENELRKLYPFLGMYLIHVDMSSIGKDFKTAFGRVVVASDISRPSDTSTLGSSKAVKASRAKRKSITIPFIIKDGKLLPMDVFVTENKTYPITEARVSRALFRSDLHDTLSDSVKDNFSANMYTHYGQDPSQVPGTNSYNSYKMSSFKNLVGATGYKEHLAEFGNDVSSFDTNQKQVLLKNGAAAKFLAFATRTISKTAKDIEDVEKVAKSIPPTATMVYRDGDHYVAKMASHELFSPVELKFDRGPAIKALGEALVKKADLGKRIVKVYEPTAKIAQVEQKTFKGRIDNFGMYQVPTSIGVRTGIGFPDVYDPVTGKKEPFSVFVSDSVYAIGEKIPATKLDTVDTISHPHAMIEGLGLVAIKTGDVNNPVTVYGPIQIEKSYFTLGVQKYVAHSARGDNFTIILDKAMKDHVYTDGVWWIPKNIDWIPLHEEVSVSGLKNAVIKKDTVVVTKGPNYTYKFSGEPVSNLPNTIFSHPEAEFILAVLGTPRVSIEEILDRASKDPVHVIGCRKIRLLEPNLKAAMDKVANVRSIAEDIRTNLLKEALFVPDPESVDALLGLNFINEDNIQEFVNRIPQLDETLSTLSNLLLYVRLGLSSGPNQIPESALTRAISGLDTVIDKLDRLRYVGSSDKSMSN